MPKEEIYDLLRTLELVLDNGFPLVWGGFVIVKSKEVLDIIDKIEFAIPPEIQEAHDYGIHNSSADFRSVYAISDNMKAVINTSFSLFLGLFVLINLRKILPLVDEMYTRLPVELVEARAFLSEKR